MANDTNVLSIIASSSPELVAVAYGAAASQAVLGDSRIKTALTYVSYVAETIQIPGVAPRILSLYSTVADLNSLADKNTTALKKVGEQALSLVLDYGTKAATKAMLEEAGVVAGEVFIGFNPETWPVVAGGLILTTASNTFVDGSFEVDKEAASTVNAAKKDLEQSSEPTLGNPVPEFVYGE